MTRRVHAVPPTDDDWAPLRDAVPSYRDRWNEASAYDWHDPADPTNVQELAHHLVQHSAVSRVEEMETFFDALGVLYDGAGDELYDLLTVGLLEDIIHVAQDEGVGAGALIERLTRLALRHPSVREPWLAALY